MTKGEVVYRSILSRLSVLTVEELEEVNQLIDSFIPEKPSAQKGAILKFAGAWDDMSEKDFQDFQREVSHTRSDMLESKGLGA